MKPIGAIALLGLVAALVAMEVWSNAALKRLGVTPSRSVTALRIANLVAVILVVGFAVWVLVR